MNTRMINKHVIECGKCGQYVSIYDCGGNTHGPITTIYCGYCGKESEMPTEELIKFL